MKITFVSQIDPSGVGGMIARAIGDLAECTQLTLSGHPFFETAPLPSWERVADTLRDSDAVVFLDCDWTVPVPFDLEDVLRGRRVAVDLASEPAALASSVWRERYGGRNVRAFSAWPHMGLEPMPIPLPDWGGVPAPRNAKPVVAHAATCPPRKGSFLLQYVAERIPEIEVRLLPRQSHEATLRDMAGADVYFDEIWLQGVYGLGGLEAMCLGRPSLAYVDDAMHAHIEAMWGEPAPFVRVTPETLEAELRRVAEDPRDPGGRDWYVRRVASCAGAFVERLAAVEPFA